MLSAQVEDWGKEKPFFGQEAVCEKTAISQDSNLTLSLSIHRDLHEKNTTRMCLNPRNPNLWNIFLQSIWEFSLCWDTEGPEQFIVTQEDMHIFRAASIRTRQTRWKTTTWKTSQVLRSICIMLIHTENTLQLASCLTGCIADVGAVKLCLCWVCVAGSRYSFSSVSFSHLIPSLSLSVSSSPSLSLSLLPSSLLSVNPPVTEALPLLIQTSGSTAR